MRAAAKAHLPRQSASSHADLQNETNAQSRCLIISGYPWQVQQMCQTGTTVDTRLLSGFSSQEVQTLYSFLDRMFQNLE